jgi:hypothetical protein
MRRRLALPKHFVRNSRVRSPCFAKLSECVRSARRFEALSLHCAIIDKTGRRNTENQLFHVDGFGIFPLPHVVVSCGLLLSDSEAPSDPPKFARLPPFQVGVCRRPLL